MKEANIKLGNITTIVKKSRIVKEAGKRTIPSLVKNIDDSTLFFNEVLIPMVEKHGSFSKKYGFSLELPVDKYNDMVNEVISNNHDLNLNGTIVTDKGEALQLDDSGFVVPEASFDDNKTLVGNMGNYCNGIQNSLKQLIKGRNIKFGYRKNVQDRTIDVKIYTDVPVGANTEE